MVSCFLLEIPSRFTGLICHCRSKSFFREAFWFPAAFAKQSTWLSVETLKQTLYPFILVSTVLQFLYAPTTLLRPVFWLATMFGVAAIKSTYGFIVSGDPQLLLFTFYGSVFCFNFQPVRNSIAYRPRSHTACFTSLVYCHRKSLRCSPSM